MNGTDTAIREAYRQDCETYCKWQYHNPELNSKNAWEAKILRQAHILEKGMSVGHPRPGFGVAKALELLEFVEDFQKAGFRLEDSASVRSALGVLDAYLRFHAQRGFVPEEVLEKFQPLRRWCPEDRDNYGIHQVTLSQMQQDIHGEFPAFFRSRHSVRQFVDAPVRLEDVQKAVRLAMHAPSACNRQSCKVYFYSDRATNDRLGELIAGNTGFDGDVQHYLVLTSDISAFYDDFERNQTYVDGGIFALALAESLHYYGIASCILQNGEFEERNRAFREICGNIPENEKIILFLAIGYYPDSFTHSASHRKPLEDVLKVR